MGSAVSIRQTVKVLGVSFHAPLFQNLADDYTALAYPARGKPGTSNNGRGRARRERGDAMNVRLAVAALACCGAWPAFAQGTLVVDDIPVLLADPSGTVTVAIALHNTGAQPMAVHLRVTDFEHQPSTGAPYPLGAASAFSATSEADKSVLNGTPLPPGGVLNVKLTVSRLWEAGESTALLQNDDQDIHTRSGTPQTVLRELHIPAAFNVRIDAGATDPPEIRFSALGSGGGKLLVRLVNSDPMSYRFRWSLRLGNDLRASPNPYVDLPANGSAFLDLTPASPKGSGVLGWLSQLLAAGTLKDEIESGDLVLEPMLGQVAMPPLAPKVLPLSARVRFWSDGFQELANVICVFLLLTAGGITSIWVHCGMPNTTRALALQRRLSALNQQIEALGTDIPSQWRVLLAAHPKGICKSLTSMWWVFPAFAELVDRLENDVAMVETWGAVAYDVSIVKRQMRQQQQAGIPPTVLGWVDDLCSHALAPIETGFTNDEELQSMRADVKKARQYLALAAARTQIADLEKEVMDRENRIQACLPIVAKAWPDEFGNLIEQVSNSISTPMDPDLYIDRDTLTLKVNLLNQFRELRERAQALEPAAMAAAAGGAVTGSASESAVTRLEAHRERLFAYLRPDAPESLRLARLFVTEMRQDIYERALLAEMGKTPPAVAVQLQPLIAEPEAPVHFALRFSRDLLNDAAACQEWACTWDFGDGSQRETGWEVYHSFGKNGLYEVRVEIASLDGRVVTQAPLQQNTQVGRQIGPLPASERVRRAWRWMRPHAETMLEASRLALVLAVAVFGLVTTARQQATTLTTLEALGAVFALGFGADTLKTLITERRS